MEETKEINWGMRVNKARVDVEFHKSREHKFKMEIEKIKKEMALAEDDFKKEQMKKKKKKKRKRLVIID